MKEIGEYFKERFELFEPNPPADFWSKIQNDKTLKRFNRKQSFKRFMKFGFTPAAVVVVAILFWVSNIQKENTPNTIDGNTPQTNTLVKQQITINDIQPDTSPITETENSIQESNSSVKSVDNKIDNKISKNSEPIKNTQESTISPITNTQSSISNKTVQSPTSINVPSQNSFKEHSKISPNRNPSLTTKSEPIENNTSDIEEPLPEIVNDKTNTINPEEDIDKLLIPNSFTPNGDGINDYFLVKAMWNVEDFELLIYERSGNVVFKTNEMGMGWDGTYLGKEIHAGVYVYLITYKDSNGNKLKTKGTLNLLR